ncbi:alpha-amylase [Pinibacter aurantiacus]|uniref:Alpha-amylase n=1 Tax=Pinibacter aurantiacus TaxID=2851599 RepID=A0A9E2W6E9_9BACT|nr:alpha-amylase [Pinibacter aurantiacus]MBV4359989.1 alpha-amylase [Pinibacter aurantiacus]
MPNSLNPVIIQFFHWYYPGNGRLWNDFVAEAPNLAKHGFTNVWFPPAYKGCNGGYSIGYDAYDLFDLGEFDQKGTIPTKYGTKEQYLKAIEAAHKNNMGVIADAVFNHKAGADELEKFTVKKVNPDDRNEFISDHFDIEAWTKFTFPGRNGKYSEFIWDHKCFSGVDWANDINEDGVYSIQNEYGEGWEEVMESELGNYDYLMYADIEFRNAAVREELKYWGKWYLEQTHVDGFRLDAVKHIASYFFNEWIDYMRSLKEEYTPMIGEYWNIHDVNALLRYIDVTKGRMQLFDAPLHHNFYVASKAGKDFDLRNIFNNTLVQQLPTHAVTIVDNHDTQPLQSLESPVEDWFKPLALSLILLRVDGTPCVFHPALYGAEYTDNGHDGQGYDIKISPVDILPTLLRARKDFAFGMQRDYFNHGNCIGWTREGIKEVPGSGCAVVLSNGTEGFKDMQMGNTHANETFVDLLGRRKEKVELNGDGWGKFMCDGGSVSVWINEKKIKN